MATVTFDTLKFANQLKAAGVPAGHAEAEAKALSEVFETNLSELATKEDLHREIRELDLRMHGEMLLMKWMLGLLLAGVASLILKSFFGA